MLFSDPFRELDQLTSELFRRPLARIPLSVWRNEEDYRFEFSVPGVTADQLDLRLDGQQLTLTVDRPYVEGKGEELLNEHVFGVQKRTLRLSDNLDAANIAAHLTDGVLTLTVPVRSETQARAIPIQSAEELTAATE